MPMNNYSIKMYMWTIGFWLNESRVPQKEKYCINLLDIIVLYAYEAKYSGWDKL